METEDTAAQMKTLDEEIARCQSMLARENEKMETYKVCYTQSIIRDLLEYIIRIVACFSRKNIDETCL